MKNDRVNACEHGYFNSRRTGNINMSVALTDTGRLLLQLLVTNIHFSTPAPPTGMNRI